MPFEITDKKIGPQFHHDFVRHYTTDKAKIAACQMQNKKDDQEDFLVASVDEVQDFSQFSYENQKFILQYVFMSLQRNYGQHENGGSTACFAMAWVDGNRKLKVWTANVGDSAASLIILDKELNVLHAEGLHRLHKPTDANEAERILKEGGAIKGNRLNGTLDMSRAIGDIKHEYLGISHAPDIDCLERELEEGDQAFIVVASDGLVPLDYKKIATIVKESSANLAEAAEILVSQAANPLFHNRDNISAVIFTPGASAAVFDGHSGKVVSKELSEKFYPMLQLTIQEALTTPGWIDTHRALLQGIELALVEDRHRIQQQLSAIENKFQLCKEQMSVFSNVSLFLRKYHTHYELHIRVNNMLDMREKIVSIINKFEIRCFLSINGKIYCTEWAVFDIFLSLSPQQILSGTFDKCMAEIFASLKEELSPSKIPSTSGMRASFFNIGPGDEELCSEFTPADYLPGFSD